MREHGRSVVPAALRFPDRVHRRQGAVHPDRSAGADDRERPVVEIAELDALNRNRARTLCDRREEHAEEFPVTRRARAAAEDHAAHRIDAGPLVEHVELREPDGAQIIAFHDIAARIRYGDDGGVDLEDDFVPAYLRGFHHLIDRESDRCGCRTVCEGAGRRHADGMHGSVRTDPLSVYVVCVVASGIEPRNDRAAGAVGTRVAIGGRALSRANGGAVRGPEGCSRSIDPLGEEIAPEAYPHVPVVIPRDDGAARAVRYDAVVPLIRRRVAENDSARRPQSVSGSVDPLRIHVVRSDTRVEPRDDGAPEAVRHRSGPLLVPRRRAYRLAVRRPERVARGIQPLREYIGVVGAVAIVPP